MEVVKSRSSQRTVETNGTYPDRPNPSQRELADAIGVPYQRVNEIVNERRGVTPSTALRLSQVFGTTSEFWLNEQMRWDLYHAQQTEQKELQRIPRYRHRRSAGERESA
jgi:antitoxin HigA-1